MSQFFYFAILALHYNYIWCLINFWFNCKLKIWPIIYVIEKAKFHIQPVEGRLSVLSISEVIVISPGSGISLNRTTGQRSAWCQDAHWCD